MDLPLRFQTLIYLVGKYLSIIVAALSHYNAKSLTLFFGVAATSQCYFSSSCWCTAHSNSFPFLPFFLFYPNPQTLFALPLWLVTNIIVMLTWTGIFLLWGCISWQSSVMELLDLFITSLIPVIKVLLVIAVGFFLAIERIDLLGTNARHHLNNVSSHLSML